MLRVTPQSQRQAIRIMATQRLTIVKIAGAAGDSTVALFRRWDAMRPVRSREEWSSDQWPDAVRQEAEDWLNRLRENRDRPPVLFYSEYVDLWSFCPPMLHFRDEDGLLQMCGDRHALFCLPLRLEEAVRARLENVCVEGQYDEDRLFAKIVLEAATAWDGIAAAGALVMLRRLT